MFYPDELRAYIDNNGLKQKFIAEKAKIDETRLSRILAGKAKCTADEYFRICLALDIPYERFCHE